MALYRVLVHGLYATIRPADHGITDAEWEAGVRNALPTLASSAYDLEALVPWEVTVLSNEDWNMMFENKDREDLPSSKWKDPVDKWDTPRKIY